MLDVQQNRSAVKIIPMEDERLGDPANCSHYDSPKRRKISHNDTAPHPGRLMNVAFRK